MTLETTSTETTSLPASAFPSGTDQTAYITEMTGKVDAANGVQPAAQTPATETPTTATRPDNIPEKFWDAAKGEAKYDELLKSYTALEAKLGAATPAVETPKVEGDAATATAETPKLDTAIQAFSTRYAESGGVVTDADIASLEAAGLPRATVDTYLSGLAAIEKLAVLDAHEVAGGKDKFETALKWAATGLTTEEQAYYEKSTSQFGSHKPGVEWLMSKYNGANPSEGTLLGAQPGGTGEVYNSDQEMMTAMSDPKYKTDPAYREQVAQTLLRSKNAGTIQTNARHYGRR